MANGKAVTVNLSLSGSAAGNYTLTQTTASTTANITALGITGSITAGSKTYDATTTAAITGRSLAGVLAGDTGNVTLTGGTATFSDKNVANGKTVTGSGFSLTGTASGNYSLTSVGTTTANITKAPLTITALTNTKLWNGTTAAAAVPTVSGIISGTERSRA